MKLLDPEGAASRKRRRLKRRRYFNRGPNFLVHVDQNDKLRKFGLCLHAMIDGQVLTYFITQHLVKKQNILPIFINKKHPTPKIKARLTSNNAMCMIQAMWVMLTVTSVLSIHGTINLTGT